MFITLLTIYFQFIYIQFKFSVLPVSYFLFQFCELCTSWSFSSFIYLINGSESPLSTRHSAWHPPYKDDVCLQGVTVWKQRTKWRVHVNRSGKAPRLGEKDLSEKKKGNLYTLGKKGDVNIELRKRKSDRRRWVAGRLAWKGRNTSGMALDSHPRVRFSFHKERFKQCLQTSILWLCGKRRKQSPEARKQVWLFNQSPSWAWRS